MHFFINKMVPSPSVATATMQYFYRTLNELCGREVALSFYDSKNGKVSEPEPINVTIERVDRDSNKIWVSIPLDLVYGVDTELY
jgi:hypothetical protein